MWVTLKGEPDAHGMVVDFQDIKALLKPLIEAWDHATLVDASDTELLQVVKALQWKHYVLPYDSTAENLCCYVLEWLYEHGRDVLEAKRIREVTVRIAETETCYAEVTWKIHTATPDEPTEHLKFYA